MKARKEAHQMYDELVECCEDRSNVFQFEIETGTQDDCHELKTVNCDTRRSSLLVSLFQAIMAYLLLSRGLECQHLF